MSQFTPGYLMRRLLRPAVPYLTAWVVVSGLLVAAVQSPPPSAVASVQVVTSATVSTPAPTPLAEPRPLRIMPLGDSITGSGDGSYRLTLWRTLVDTDHLQLDFVGTLQDGPGTFDRDNEGHSGWTIPQLTSQIDTWLAAARPDVILLNIGTNDLTQPGVTGLTIAARLDQLLARIYAADSRVQVVVSTILPHNLGGEWQNLNWQLYNASIPGLVSKYARQGHHIQLADLAAADWSYSATDFRDGVHPTQAGFQKMADVWYPVVKPLFYAPPPEGKK